MKIHIWIHKSEVISGKIRNYSLTRPYQDRNDEWVEVQISSDEFAKLEDRPKISSKSIENYAHLEESITKTKKEEDWLVEQYNRNRLEEDWIKNRADIPFIYERVGEDVYRRREGDSVRELITNDEFKSSIKPIKKGLKELLKELQTIPGKDFENWWKGLNKQEQIELTKFWE